MIQGDPSGYGYWWQTTAMVALSVLAVGYVTENKRHLLKKWIERRLLRFETFVHQNYGLSR